MDCLMFMEEGVSFEINICIVFERWQNPVVVEILS